MALIKCIECGNKISDKATTCPCCGAPASISIQAEKEAKYPVYYDNEVMEADRVLACMHDNLSEAKHAIWDMCDEAGVPEDDETVSCFIDQIYALYEQKYDETAPKIELILPYSQAQINQIEYEQRVTEEKAIRQQQNVPKCPTCGSTDLTKLGVAARAIDGLVFGRLSVEGRAQFRCNKCGYMW